MEVCFSLINHLNLLSRQISVFFRMKGARRGSSCRSLAQKQAAHVTSEGFQQRYANPVERAQESSAETAGFLRVPLTPEDRQQNAAPWQPSGGPGS